MLLDRSAMPPKEPARTAGLHPIGAFKHFGTAAFEMRLLRPAQENVSGAPMSRKRVDEPQARGEYPNNMPKDRS